MADLDAATPAGRNERQRFGSVTTLQLKGQSEKSWQTQARFEEKHVFFILTLDFVWTSSTACKVLYFNGRFLSCLHHADAFWRCVGTCHPVSQVKEISNMQYIL